MPTAKKRKNLTYERLAWVDRFQKPTFGQLRDGLAAPARHHFDAIRKHLATFDNMREELAWHGDCWKWTIEFYTRLTEEPLAVLIPSPDDLQIALPIDKEFSQSLPVKRLKRAVRDGLELAQEPFDTHWGVWSVGGGAGGGLLDDLQDLIEMKMKHLAKRAG